MSEDTQPVWAQGVKTHPAFTGEETTVRPEEMYPAKMGQIVDTRSADVIAAAEARAEEARKQARRR